MKVRIGTRRSRLALAQTELVSVALSEKYPDIKIQTVEIITRGARVSDKPLDRIGGKGVFVEEIEQALLSGDIDIAVHSAKDLPVQLAQGLIIAGVLPRGDSRDMLITRSGFEYDSGSKFTVGTGSLRRRRGFSAMYPNAVFADIRGNVDTRLRKLSDGEYDGVILCAAGIQRLGLPLDGFDVRMFDCRELIPAPCQGIIAAECAVGSPAESLLRCISDPVTSLCFAAEREIIAALGADCTVPVGAYTEINNGMLDIIISDSTGRTFGGRCRPELYSQKIKELTAQL